MPRLPAAIALAFAFVLAAQACGTGAAGVGTCKSIEEARCRQVPNCPNVAVSPPIWFTSGTAVDACIRYYETACLHGLASGSDPGTVAVNACVAAIDNNGCGVVAAPETDPACAWLVPVAPAPVDAGTADVEAASDAD
jgi:hypothetical protein